MTSFSQARFGEVDPNIAISRASAPADTSIAQAIDAFGNIGGQIRQGLLQSNLKRDLGETGNIIATINAGEDAIQDAVRRGQIDPTTEKFQRLAAATEQGKISQQRAALEAEVLLRTSISMAPGFADQLRRTARDALGFDPTGGALNALYMSGPGQGAERITQEMKDLEEADQLVATGFATNREAALRLIVGARAAQLKDNVDSNLIKQGKVNAGKVAVIGANRAQNAANATMLQAFAQIRQTGGIQDVEALTSTLIAQREAVKSQLENEMASSEEHLYENSAYNDMRSRVDDVFAANIEIIETQDIVKMLSRHEDKLEAIIAIEGIAIAPDLAIIKNFGESAVASYLELMASAEGDPRTLEELVKINAQYRFLADVAMKAEGISPALKAAARGALGEALASGEVDLESAQTVARYEGIGVSTGRIEPEQVGRIVAELEDTDMPVTALSTAANTRDSYAHMNEDQRSRVARNFRIQQVQQALTISDRLSGSDVSMVWTGERFELHDPASRTAAQINPLTQVGGTLSAVGSAGRPGQRFVQNTLARDLGIKEQVDFVNDTLLKMAKDKRWVKEFGFDSTDLWAAALTNNVNSGIVTEEPVAAPAIQVDEEGEFIDAVSGSLVRDEQGQIIDSSQPPVREAGVSITPPGMTEPMEFDNTIQAEIARYEGLHTPETSLVEGNVTAGFGRDLTVNPLSPEEFALIGLPSGASDQEVVKHLAENPEVAKRLLDHDIRQTTQALSRVRPAFTSLPEDKQAILTNMAFNLGAQGASGFNRMWAALEKTVPDYNTAANEMLNSCWAQGKASVPGGGCATAITQPGNIKRAAVLAERLRNPTGAGERAAALILNSEVASINPRLARRMAREAMEG
jgi:hypothetical protein